MNLIFVFVFVPPSMSIPSLAFVKCPPPHTVSALQKSNTTPSICLFVFLVRDPSFIRTHNLLIKVEHRAPRRAFVCSVRSRAFEWDRKTLSRRHLSVISVNEKHPQMACSKWVVRALHQESGFRRIRACVCASWLMSKVLARYVPP